MSESETIRKINVSMKFYQQTAINEMGREILVYSDVYMEMLTMATEEKSCQVLQKFLNPANNSKKRFLAQYKTIICLLRIREQKEFCWWVGVCQKVSLNEQRKIGNPRQKKGQFTFTLVCLLCIFKTPSNITIKVSFDSLAHANA
jgi:hypothetical protein